MTVSLRPANRLFVAAEIPPRARAALGRAAAALAATTGGRPVPDDSLHVTLDFLGRVHPDRGEALVGAVRSALAGPAIAVALGEVRARPRPARARLVAVELHDPAGALARRARAVRRAVDAILGRPPDPAPFWPHVTVLRLRRPRRVDPGRAALSEHLFDISRAGLYDSETSPEGPPRYRELAAVDLAPVP